MSGTPEYKAWLNIRARCYNQRHVSYKYYGALGITVCRRWQSFELFLRDMGPRPSPDHSIDRKDSRGNYTPRNCRWATEVVQQNNRRNNRRLTFDGITLSTADWNRRRGFPKGTITHRLWLGWDVTRAISEPVGPKNFGDTTR